MVFGEGRKGVMDGWRGVCLVIHSLVLIFLFLINECSELRREDFGFHGKGEEGKRRMLGIFIRGMLERRVRVRVSKG